MIFSGEEEVTTEQYCIVRGKRLILHATKQKVTNLWVNKMAAMFG